MQPRLLLAMPAGRPTKYNKDIYVKLQEYLDSCEDTFDKEIISESSSDKSQSTGYKIMFDINLPTKQGFAAFLGVDTDTIQDWERKYKEFSVAMKRLMAIQADRLFKGGLSGKYNPKITAVLLAANHGIREQAPVAAPPVQPPGMVQNNFNLILQPEYKEALKSFDGSVRDIIMKDIKARRGVPIANGQTTSHNSTNDVDHSVDNR